MSLSDFIAFLAVVHSSCTYCRCEKVEEDLEDPKYKEDDEEALGGKKYFS